MAKSRSNMHPENIKAAIRIGGQTMAALSRKNGYQASAVRKTLRQPWPAVEKIIASAIGKKPQEIWPSRYDADGNPKHGRQHAKSISRATSGNVQKDVAA